MHESFKDGFEKEAFLYVDPNAFKRSIRSVRPRYNSSQRKIIASGMIEEKKLNTRGFNRAANHQALSENNLSRTLKKTHPQGTLAPGQQKPTEMPKHVEWLRESRQGLRNALDDSAQLEHFTYLG